MGRYFFWRTVLIFLLSAFSLGAQALPPLEEGWPWEPLSSVEAEELKPQLPSQEDSFSFQYRISLEPRVFPGPGISIPEHHLIVDFVNRYKPGGSLHSSLKRALERGNPFLPFIHKKAMEAGVPVELMWLPVIESSFVSTATSRVGARGMWQFMRNSVSRDMVLDGWRDDRLDFWKSTEAAFQKLSYNYRVLGDWYLALAAYNAGLPRIQGLLRRYGGDYWTLADQNRLPRETKLYVPKFLAVVHTLSRTQANGLNLNWERGENWVQVPLGGRQLDLELVATHLGVTYSKLKGWNPEVLHRVTPPGSYALKIPEAYQSLLLELLENPQGAAMRYHRYQVRQGDTISEIAQHYGIGQNMIHQYNPGIRGSHIKIGQTLLIPSLRDVGPYRVGSPSPPVATEASGRIHQVKKGDTLWSLSRSYGTTVEAIRQLNNLSANGIHKEGSTIRIPV